MKKEVKKKNKVEKGLYWTPRILSIIFILFLTLFSLDIFSEGMKFWDIVLGLLIHNIPVFILVILLWISWKREIVGALTFFIAGLIYIGFILVNSIINGFEWFYLTWALQIAGPAFIVGYLFYLNWKKKNKI